MASFGPLPCDPKTGIPYVTVYACDFYEGIVPFYIGDFYCKFCGELCKVNKCGLSSSHNCDLPMDLYDINCRDEYEEIPEVIPVLNQLEGFDLLYRIEIIPNELYVTLGQYKITDVCKGFFKGEIIESIFIRFYKDGHPTNKCIKIDTTKWFDEIELHNGYKELEFDDK